MKSLILALATLISTQALAGEPYICRLLNWNENAKQYERVETKLVGDEYQADLETKDGHVRLNIWRSSAKYIGTEIYTEKDIHVKFTPRDHSQAIERKVNEGEVLQSTIANEWRIVCSPLFPVYIGRIKK